MALPPKYRLPITILCLLIAFGAGYLAHGQLQEETRPARMTKVVAMADSLYGEDEEDAENEVDELLRAILALEQMHPTISRSFGYQYNLRAGRYLIANRLLTDREVAKYASGETEARLDRLRSALDNFSSAMPDAACTHYMPASAYQREATMQSAELERMIRTHVAGGDGVMFEHGKDEKPATDSPPIDIERMREIILKSPYRPSLIDTNDPKEMADAKASRQALIDSLPQLQQALKEWPPEFSKQIDAFVQGWVKDWFED